MLHLIADVSVFNVISHPFAPLRQVPTGTNEVSETIVRKVYEVRAATRAPLLSTSPAQAAARSAEPTICSPAPLAAPGYSTPAMWESGRAGAAARLSDSAPEPASHPLTRGWPQGAARKPPPPAERDGSRAPPQAYTTLGPTNHTWRTPNKYTPEV